MPNLSLVILAYNEEASVAGFLDESLAWLDTIPGEHDIVVVDDGSADQTRNRADSVAQRDPRVQVISHGTNAGMGAGMRTGIRAARGDYFSILAADGQNPASSLDALLPELAQTDIVLSVYSHREDRKYRMVLSMGLRAAMKLILGISFRMEGIYLFPVRVARDKIGVDNIEANTFFFSFELIARAIDKGYGFRTVEVEARAREHGQSKVANLRRIRRVAKEVIDFGRRRRRERRRDR